MSVKRYMTYSDGVEGSASLGSYTYTYESVTCTPDMAGTKHNVPGFIGRLQCPTRQFIRSGQVRAARPLLTSQHTPPTPNIQHATHTHFTATARTHKDYDTHTYIESKRTRADFLGKFYYHKAWSYQAEKGQTSAT